MYDSTNVAETSLTIPNTRLVVDAGLANEARYDAKRRITVLELVRISRSSADQRKASAYAILRYWNLIMDCTLSILIRATTLWTMELTLGPRRMCSQGRAGRTAPGYCIRLYAEEELVRENVMAEILRSSLDDVVLELARLGQDPSTFPLMDRPDAASLEASKELLRRLGCLEGTRITKRGELFSDLPFEPRLSWFVHECHERYGTLEAAARVAAILSAPGSVFYMGGANQEAKDEAKRRVALSSAQHESDLLHLLQVFKEWKDKGDNITNGACQGCDKPPRRGKKGSAPACRSCRIDYAMSEGLNNKCLEAVEQTASTVVDTVGRWKAQGQRRRPSGAVADAEGADIMQVRSQI